MPPKRTIFRLRDSATAHATRDQPASSAMTSLSCQCPTTILCSSRRRAADEAELAVAVGRLVQVHEVHVDLRPRQLAIELRVQVRHRLRSGASSPAIHIFAGENVCIQVITPTHAGDALASRHICGMASGPLSVGFHTTRTGSLASRCAAISRGVLGDLVQASPDRTVPGCRSRTRLPPRRRARSAHVGALSSSACHDRRVSSLSTNEPSAK